MTVAWSDLTEVAPPPVPAGAVSDRSAIAVVGYDRHVLSEGGGSGVALVRDTLVERFTGGLDGEGRAEHLRVIRAGGGNTFVGSEVFTGSVGGRRGSFALTCHGSTSAEGVVHGFWHVVAGSGTEELARLRGRGEFTARRGADGMWRSEDVFTHWYE